MPDTHPVAGTRPAGAPPYEPVVRIGTPPPAAMPSNQVPSRVHQTVLLPPDATDGDGDDDVALPAAITHATHAQAATSASNVRWYIYVASGLAGAVLVTAIYGLLGARSGSSANRADTTRAPVMDSAVLDRRADTLALAISAFSLRASMYDSRRMPCSGLARDEGRAVEGRSW